MSAAPQIPSDPSAFEQEAERLAEALRRQVAAVKAAVEAHRATMLAAGLALPKRPPEAASWAPREPEPDEDPDRFES